MTDLHFEPIASPLNIKRNGSDLTGRITGYFLYNDNETPEIPRAKITMNSYDGSSGFHMTLEIQNAISYSEVTAVYQKMAEMKGGQY